MTFLPIVERELRVASRRRGTYWIRSGVGAAVILLAVVIFLNAMHEQSRQLGQILFGSLTGCALVFCLLQGVRSTADCLSEEKREGTLGLLFLTDLKGYDVVLGKLVATSLNAFYGLLAVVPVLAIPLLLGGVTPGEFGRMALVLLNAIFFSLAAGIAVSSVCKSARKAMAGTFLLILLFTVALPILGAWVHKLRSPVFLVSSAGFAFTYAFDRPFRADPARFWWSIAIVHALGWIFLAAASLIAPRAWQDRPAGMRLSRWRDFWHQWHYGNTAERRAFRTRLLSRNAFFWLASRMRFKPAYVWIVLGLAAVAWAWGAIKLRNEWLNEGIYIATALILNTLLKGWLGSEVGRQLAEDRKLGALELLLSTPLEVKDILRGQWLALQRQFLGPLIVVLLVQFVFLQATVRNPEWNTETGFWVALWLLSMVMLVADLIALYWLGMWMGMTARNPNRASSATAVRILVVPWAVFGLVSMAVSWSEFNPGGKFFLGLWFGLGLATDLFYGFWSRHKLHTEFRRVAMQRYAPIESFWKRWFGAAQSPNRLNAAIKPPIRHDLSAHR